MAGERQDPRADLPPAAPPPTSITPPTFGARPPAAPSSDTAPPAPPHRPERPAFQSTLPHIPDVAKPWTLTAVWCLLLVAALNFVVFTAAAVTHQEATRVELEKLLAERAPDYPANDVETAVVITLIVALSISIVLVLGEFWAAQQLSDQRRGGRSALLVLTVLHLPVLLVTPALRNGGLSDDVAAGVQAVCLVAAVLVSMTPSTSQWLKSRKRRERLPFAPSEYV